MARYGYARVSTHSQKDDSQLDALRAARCDRIWTDKASGKRVRRAQWDNLLASLREGDQLVITRLSRMARSVKHLTEIAALVSPDVSPIERSMVDMIQYVQEHAVPEVVSWPVQGGQIQDLMQRSHQEIAFGQSDIAGTVSKFFDEAEFILE